MSRPVRDPTVWSSPREKDDEWMLEPLGRVRRAVRSPETNLSAHRRLKAEMAAKAAKAASKLPIIAAPEPMRPKGPNESTALRQLIHYLREATKTSGDGAYS